MNDWDNIFGEVPASFEARILDTLATLEEDKPVRRLGRRGMTSLIAAAAAIVVLGGTALATGFFGLREVEVDNPYGEVGAATQQAGSESLLIALQGYPDSSEYKATAEWMGVPGGLRPGPGSVPGRPGEPAGIGRPVRPVQCLHPGNGR